MGHTLTLICWIYNSYPYAVPFNECIVAELLASTDNLPEVFFQDDEGKVYLLPHEVFAEILAKCGFAGRGCCTSLSILYWDGG